MDTQEIRLECIKLVLGVAPEPFEQVIEKANLLAEFVECQIRQQPSNTVDKG